MPKFATSEQARAAGKVGGQRRAVAALEDRIRRLVESAPPLTEAQRARLAALLNGGPTEPVPVERVKVKVRVVETPTRVVPVTVTRINGDDAA